MNVLRSFGTVCLWSSAGLAVGQGTLPDSGVTFALETLATVPDSSPGQPARVSVVTEDPSGVLFANDQRGVLHRISDGVGTAYLDLRTTAGLSVVSTSEAGFQSFAFHPDFQKEGAPGFGRLYTLHSDSGTSETPDFDPGGSTSFHTLLLEWRTGDPTAATFEPLAGAPPFRVLIRFKQPFGNHNGGLIAFNPTVGVEDADYGNLYVAIGDGGSGGDPQDNGQDRGNPFGAILRIDPLGNDSANGRYGIVADNLSASDADPLTIPETWCYGLRNPQRFGWDAVTAACYIADIGQGSWEEVNAGGNGLNFGWRLQEGSGGGAGLVDPVAEYSHSVGFVTPPSIAIGNRAVTVGEVARGACVDGLEGILLVSDFPTGRVFRLDVDADPLDGGMDGLAEVRFAVGDGPRRTMLELINEARSDRGLGSSVRADLRFSVNTPGRVIVSNKHDGVLRRFVADQDPFIGLDGLTLDYRGVLEESTDLANWKVVRPQPVAGEDIDASGPRRFLRSVRR